MSNEHKFYRCNHCGNIVGMIQNSGVPIVCCGEKMQELMPNTSDGANEKHVPVVKIEGDLVTVEVGSILHPMEEAHFIQWIYLQTEKGGMRKQLHPSEKPVATFRLVDDKPVAVYEYCNLHGLWKTTL